MADASPATAADPVRVILLGPPGVGKGTQAALLAEWLGVPRLSTGEMLRRAVGEGTQAGRVAGPLLAKGAYVPDDVLMDILRSRLDDSDCSRGYILDGFPRTTGQAMRLHELAPDGVKAFVAFELQAPTAELLQRMSRRRREDDTRSLAEARLRAHEAQSIPATLELGRQTQVIPVDAARGIEVVQDELRAHLSGGVLA